MATGCSLLVKMMLGYMAATSKWYISGYVMCLCGFLTSLKAYNFDIMLLFTA